uniref:DUF4422 domain-containing protein n=1 Tax=Acetatifactor sp. TaxID=1872090 RepID=UPI0040564512
MAKIVIYALGELFHLHKEQIPLEQVVAFCDKMALSEELYEGISVIQPYQLEKLEFDYIIVFSNKFFSQIRNELVGEYFIREEKILSWRALISMDDNVLLEQNNFFLQYIRGRDTISVLDWGMNYLPQVYYTRNEDFFCISRLDGVGTAICPIFSNLYDHVYECMENIRCDYDIAFFWDDLACLWKEKVLQNLPAKYNVWYFPYARYNMECIENLLSDLKIIPNAVCSSEVYGMVCIVKRVENSALGDANIYVVMHKNYNVMCNDLYKPICVGTHYTNENYVNEQSGENIAHLNEKINELTALYWMWKNSDSEIIGLNHYRRYFSVSQWKARANYLDMPTLHEYMQKYDIILMESGPLFFKTEKRLMQESMSRQAFDEAFRIIEMVLKKYQPQYLQPFYQVMEGHHTYWCNMFVMRRELLDEYCTWLFSFIIEAAELFEAEKYDAYNKRAIGFLGECMLTVWLLGQNLKIKELPVQKP